MLRIIKLHGGDLGSETMLVRCDLSRAESRVEVDYAPCGHWVGTQWQCGHARHTLGGLSTLAKRIAAEAVEMPEDAFDCEWEEIDEIEVHTNQACD